MNTRYVIAFLFLLGCAASAPALGYVGPGAGLTLLSALWGLVVAVVVAVGFVALWPIRRWRRRRDAALLQPSGDQERQAEGDERVPADPSGAPRSRRAGGER